MHTPAHSLRTGYLYALAVVVIWSGFVVVSRMSGKSALTAYDVIALRYIVAGLAILPLYYRYRPKLLDARKLALTLIGAIGFTLFAFNGFRHAPANHAALIMQGFLPFAVTVMVYLIHRERPSRARLFGLVFVALGMGSLAIETLSDHNFSLMGDGLLFCACLCWALYTVLLKHWNQPPMEATIAVTMLATAIYLPSYFLFLPKHILESPWQESLFFAIYQGIIVAIIQMIFYTRAVSILGASRLALFTSCVPVLASLIAVPLLGEPLTTPIVVALVLVVLGAWVGNKRVKSNPTIRP
jgi:drug/metabolite transporter (DMT)-like permease